jgi:hypothetical protein
MEIIFFYFFPRWSGKNGGWEDSAWSSPPLVTPLTQRMRYIQKKNKKAGLHIQKNFSQLRKALNTLSGLAIVYI